MNNIMEDDMNMEKVFLKPVRTWARRSSPISIRILRTIVQRTENTGHSFGREVLSGIFARYRRLFKGEGMVGKRIPYMIDKGKRAILKDHIQASPYRDGTM